MAIAGRNVGRTHTSAWETLKVSRPEPRIEIPSVNISLDEVVKLAAVDSQFFSSHFFPKAFRQESPEFHKDIWGLLESHDRFVQALCYRGSSKTTIARAYTAKRIAYGISKTVLYVSGSEAHAARSVQWIRAQVERNELFSSTFGLSPGMKWTENEAQIKSSITGQVAWVLGVGATGNVRGINFDNYRPDLIILDDIQSDETAATPDQREKLVDLVYSALMYSLTPPSEDPSAKMVMLATPIQSDDITQRIVKDSMWKTIIFPCWTKDTWFSANSEQRSAWESRYPTDELRRTKQAHIDNNTLTKFIREQECQIISHETSAFKASWVQEFGEGETIPEPPSGMCVMAIDPVPPPSALELAKGMRHKNYEVIMIIRRSKGAYYVENYAMNRGHEPNWTIAKTFELAHKYKVARIIIDSFGYQAVLGTLIESEMRRRGIYYPLIQKKERRNKYNRIVSVLAGPLSQGKLYIRREMNDLREQIIAYPSTKFDDLLDAASFAVEDLSQPSMDLGSSDYAVMDETIYPDLDYVGGAP
jgi:phage terminase large subunit-like protein